MNEEAFRKPDNGGSYWNGFGKCKVRNIVGPNEYLGAKDLWEEDLEGDISLLLSPNRLEPRWTEVGVRKEFRRAFLCIAARFALSKLKVSKESVRQ
jgi:hypothetical protein